MRDELLRQIPSITELLAHETVTAWLADHPRGLVTACLREATADLRRAILADAGGRCGATHVEPAFVLRMAEALLLERTTPHIRGAINATGIILHTGLGRAVWPESVVDSMVDVLKGYVSLAISKDTGQRLDRDKQIEYILTEITGAEAATAVNNNAAATMLVLAALAAEREVVVSRGQLIEIGGSFRLPEVMAQSRARMVEVGATNRTHARDYERAIGPETVALMRVHPSNFRVVGFTAEVPLAEMAEIAHRHNVLLIDDLGAGALVDLAPYGLPHEPTVQESLAAGADLVLFSADKLIGASQGGIIVGRKDLIARVRSHPLFRAVRSDKVSLMALERTLMLFRDPERLATTHPLYRMLAQTPDELRDRAERLADAIRAAAPTANVQVEPGEGYLGSGSLPMEALPSWQVRLTVPGITAMELARRLRHDPACIVARIEHDAVAIDVRTVTDEQIGAVAAAIERQARS